LNYSPTNAFGTLAFLGGFTNSAGKFYKSAGLYATEGDHFYHHLLTLPSTIRRNLFSPSAANPIWSLNLM